MVTVIAFVGTLIVGAVLAGCSSDEFTSDPEDPNAGKGGAAGSGTTGGSTSAGGTGGAGGAEGGGGTGGSGGGTIEGINDNFYNPDNGSLKCSFRDLDMSRAGNSLFGLCGNLFRIAEIKIDPNNPMKYTSITFGKNMGAQVQTLGCQEISPTQVVEMTLPNDPPGTSSFFVPSRLVCNGSEKSALTLIQSIQAQPDTHKIDVLHYPEQTIAVLNIKSGHIFNDRLYVTANTKTETGIVFSYGLFNDSIDENDKTLPIYTTSENPAGMASLDDEVLPETAGMLAVVGTGGDNSSASIDIVTTAAVDPAYAKIATIPLGVDKVLELPELALTTDKRYGVVAGGTGSSLTNIIIINFDSNNNFAQSSVAGTIDLSAYATEIRGIEIDPIENKAHVTTVANDGTGEIITVDFSTPSSPTIKRIKNVAYDLGSIACSSAGYCYSAFSQYRWETPNPNLPEKDRRLNLGSLDLSTVPYMSP